MKWQAHTEATLTRLIKPELIQQLLHIEANIGLQIINLAKEIKGLLKHQTKLESDVKKRERLRELLR